MNFRILLNQTGLNTFVLAHITQVYLNGEAERAVRTFKTAMKTMTSEPGTMNQKIARFLLSYRSSPHSTTQVSPAELFLNRNIRTRLDIMRPNLGTKIERKTTHVASEVRTFQEGDTIWTRDYSDSIEKWVDGIIVHQLGPVTYQVKVGDLIWKRHIDQISAREPTVTTVNQRLSDGGDYDLPLMIPLPSENINRTIQRLCYLQRNQQQRSKIPVRTILLVVHPAQHVLHQNRDFHDVVPKEFHPRSWIFSGN